MGIDYATLAGPVHANEEVFECVEMKEETKHKIREGMDKASDMASRAGDKAHGELTFSRAEYELIYIFHIQMQRKR